MTVICRCCDEKRANDDTITYDDYSICAPYLSYYENKRGKKHANLLNKCDVYTLRIHNNEVLNYALVEWGIAKQLGKVLTIIFDIDPLLHDYKAEHQKLYRYLINESKKSFKNISKKMKNEVIKRHTEIPIDNFKQYKKYLSSYLGE